MRPLVLLFLLLLSLAGTAPASAEVAMEVVRSSPSLNATLPRAGSLYIEVAYRSDQALRLQARAHRNGKSLDQGQAMDASVSHPAGAGRALVWVSYREPAQIDEIRITAYDENWRPLRTLPVAARARWTQEAAHNSVEVPAWVDHLIDEEQRLTEEYRRDRPQEDDSSWVVDFLMLGVPGYFLLQIYCAWRFEGRWRMAALFPLVFMAPVLVFSAAALVQGANLWPLMVIFTAPLGFAYLCVLFPLRLIKLNARLA